MPFNLDPPPGFQGLHPHKPVEIYTRNLPHWRQAGATYFVTFNLADALPAAKQAELVSMRRDWEHRHPPPRDEKTWSRFAKQVFRQVEKWMDAGFGNCWLTREEYSAELRRSLLHFHQERYELGCFVIMSNHCHVVIRPLESHKLEDEIGSIKSITSRMIKRGEKEANAIWAQESYDRIIRDEEHLYRVVQYIGANPWKARLPRDQWNRWMNPDWTKLMWDFVDL